MRGYLITDIDNTLYDYFELAACFRAMIHVLSKKTNIDEETLIADYGEVFLKRGTIEYPYPVQELRCLQSYSEKEMDVLTELATIAFGKSYNKRLKLYDGVTETLKALTDSGWIICGITNAPLYRAYSRLQKKGILKYFSVLAGRAYEDIEKTKFINESDRIQNRTKFDRALVSLKSKNIKVFTVPPPYLKPNPKMFHTVFEHIEQKEKKPLSKLNIYAIGDNIINDLKPIKSTSHKLIWAKYGSIIEPKNKETMIKFTQWQNKERDILQKVIPEEIVDYIIMSFTELTDILGVEYQLDFKF